MQACSSSTAARRHRGEHAAAVLLLQACMQVPPAPKEAPRELFFPAAPDEPRFVFERSIRSSADILPAESASELRKLVTGEQASGEALSKPYAVAVHRGRIFVSDTVSRFVRVFDVPQGKQFKIGEEEGVGQLVKPVGLDIDAAGNLYVADIGAKAVMVYGPDRRFLRRVGSDKWFSRLSSVTVDPAGTRVYAVDLGGVTSEQHQVRVFDAVSGAHLQDIGKRGSGPGEFNLPRDLAIGKDGRLYVVDGGNFRVVVFDREGRYLHSFGSVGKQYGQFARPKEIAIDREATSTSSTPRSATSRSSTPTASCCCSSASAPSATARRSTCCPRASRWTRTAASTWSTSGSARSTCTARSRCREQAASSRARPRRRAEPPNEAPRCAEKAARLRSAWQLAPEHAPPEPPSRSRERRFPEAGLAARLRVRGRRRALAATRQMAQNLQKQARHAGHWGVPGLTTVQPTFERGDMKMPWLCGRGRWGAASAGVFAALFLASAAARVGGHQRHQSTTSVPGTGPAGRNQATDTAEICVFCHTPHGGSTTAPVPLWNKRLARSAPAGGGTYTTYATLQTPSLDGPVAAVGSISLACLSCHDGTQAMDNIINAPGSGGLDADGGGNGGRAFTWTGGTVNAAGALTSGAALIGTDLSNDHPIGIQYCGGGLSGTGAITGCRDQDFNPADHGNDQRQPGVLDRHRRRPAEAAHRPAAVRAPGETVATGPLVECGSCHDPHVSTGQAGPTGTGRVAGETFLRISNANSAVCTACHVK